MEFVLDELAVGDAADGASPPPPISALLCVAAELELGFPDKIAHKVPVVDMQPIPSGQLQEAVLWIRDHIAEHSVLVFCNAGVGRSSSVVVAYLCCDRGYSFGEAVEAVASRHPYMSILPNLIIGVDAVKRRVARG